MRCSRWSCSWPTGSKTCWPPSRWCPAGWGVVEASTATLLVGFGVPAGVATLGVLAWRLVEFWPPIPVGGVAYASSRLSAGRWAAPAEDDRPGAEAEHAGHSQEEGSSDDDTTDDHR
ncbi:MAG: lysylphosphatidylglycerol synthase transmembrane domain-containing protein [Kineosporiaceae bacterium]